MRFSMICLSMVLATMTSCSTASQVIEQSTQPEDIIYNYEWFHSVHQQIENKSIQIQETRNLISSLRESEDAEEISVLRIELRGQQASCRSLVADYNAHSAMLTRTLYQGNSLPNSYSFNVCQ